MPITLAGWLCLDRYLATGHLPRAAILGKIRLGTFIAGFPVQHMFTKPYKHRSKPMRRLFLALCLLLLPAALSAANPEQVSYPSGDQTVHALLYLPSGKGPHPAVVVIHEWWGLNDQIK